MAKILEFSTNTIPPAPQDNIFWMIILQDDIVESVSVQLKDDKSCSCSIFTTSFDRLPALKKKALEKMKIAKATMNGGAAK